MIILDHIYKSYQSGDIRIPVLNGVSLRIESGEFCAIMGPSGSGKTTLLNIIGLLDLPDSGRYLYRKKDMLSASPEMLSDIRNSQFGFIFQSFHLQPRLSALDNVALPLFYRAVSKQEGRRLAQAHLERVGLSNRTHHWPEQLSGGQRQRVAIARALVVNPSLILADEPTGNLDSVAAQDILALLTELNQETGVTVIIVTHDKSIFMQCKRRICIQDGVISSDETKPNRVVKST